MNKSIKIWQMLDYAVEPLGIITENPFRQVPVVPQALKIIEVVKTSNKLNGWYDNGFLFLNKGERMTTRTI